MEKQYSNLKKLLANDFFYFSSLFLLIIWLFRNAFRMNFFADDYFFLKISRINNIYDFLKFYSPFRDFSYKPLATETFYFIIHLLNNNAFIAHSIVFVVYFIGLIYLYNTVKLLTNDAWLSKLTVFLYGISFVHVFQLYWFATFQEIALFSFLTISFYLFITKKPILSIVFFILAALCKETAALYLPFSYFYVIQRRKNNLLNIKKNTSYLISMTLLTGFFYYLYQFGLKNVTSLDNYKITLNIKLLLNNGMWYALWANGFPNFMSDYFTSIFSKPLPVFWGVLKIPYIKIYFYSLLCYLIIFLVSFIVLISQETKKLKDILYIILFSLLNFYIFLGPILFFRHKWMIRLAVPLIFIMFLQSFLLLTLYKNKITKPLSIVLLCLYFLFNFYGIITHESSSLYLMENDIYLKSEKYFAKNKEKISNSHIIYIQDNNNNKNSIYKNSQKLYNSFHDQNFTDHFFPGKKIKVIYGFKDKNTLNNSFIIPSELLIQ